MLARASLSFLLLTSLSATIPVRAQVSPSASGSDSGSQMSMPTAVSGSDYAMTTGSEERSNYLDMGIVGSPSYIDNVTTGSNGKPEADESYSITPSISLNRSQPRQSETFSYNPGFLFYQKLTSQNSFNQSASAGYSYRLSPTVGFSAGDSFSRTSNVFSQSQTFSASGVSGSTQTSAATIIAPFAEQMLNTANGEIHYQFGRDGMIGGGGSFQTFNIPDASAAPGLYNSRSTNAFAFYSRRLGSSQYFGAAYGYSRTLAFPQDAQVSGQAGTPVAGQVNAQTNAVTPFYMLNVKHSWTFSLSGGILHLAATEINSPSSYSWSPSVVAGVSWQRTKAAISGSYSRSISSGQGLLGVYHSSRIGGAVRWRLNERWTTEFNVSYVSISDAAPGLASALSYTGGNTLAAQATVEHTLTERFNLAMGYQRLQESYSGIQAIANNPDSDRVFVSLGYYLRRPLGR